MMARWGEGCNRAEGTVAAKTQRGIDQTLRPPVLHSEGTGDALSLSSQPKITPLPAVWGEQSEAEERHSGAAREAGPVPRLVACKMHPKPQQRAQALQ